MFSFKIDTNNDFWRDAVRNGDTVDIFIRERECECLSETKTFEHLVTLEDLQISLLTDEVITRLTSDCLKNCIENAKALAEGLRRKVPVKDLIFITNHLKACMVQYEEAKKLFRRRLANGDTVQTAKEKNSKTNLFDSQASCEVDGFQG